MFHFCFQLNENFNFSFGKKKKCLCITSLNRYYLHWYKFVTLVLKLKYHQFSMQMMRIIVCPLIKKVKTTLLAQLKQKACIFNSFK